MSVAAAGSRGVGARTPPASKHAGVKSGANDIAFVVEQFGEALVGGRYVLASNRFADCLGIHDCLEPRNCGISHTQAIETRGEQEALFHARCRA